MSRGADEVRVRVMLVDDDRRRLTRLRAALEQAGSEVVAQFCSCDDLLAAVAEHRPDIVLIDTDSPSRDTLESLSEVSRERPRPIVLFSDDGDTETIRRAIRAGVSAYIVDGPAPSQLRALIDTAIVQFEEHQSLVREVDEAKMRLADRCDIDRAKTLLMARCKLNESEAYERLRRLAMNRKLKLGDVARAVIALSDDL